MLDLDNLRLTDKELREWLPNFGCGLQGHASDQWQDHFDDVKEMADAAVTKALWGASDFIENIEGRNVLEGNGIDYAVGILRYALEAAGMTRPEGE